MSLSAVNQLVIVGVNYQFARRILYVASTSRSACIHKIADFDHMLALALRTLFRRDGAHILEIHLDLFQWPSELVGMGGLFGARDQTASSMQDLEDSFGWSGAEGLVRLATLGHGEGSRAAPEAQAPASSSRAEQSASPQSCG
jgi:hypothetical protein